MGGLLLIRRRSLFEIPFEIFDKLVSSQTLACTAKSNPLHFERKYGVLPLLHVHVYVKITVRYGF